MNSDLKMPITLHSRTITVILLVLLPARKPSKMFEQRRTGAMCSKVAKTKMANIKQRCPKHHHGVWQQAVFIQISLYFFLSKKQFWKSIESRTPYLFSIYLGPGPDQCHTRFIAKNSKSSSWVSESHFSTMWYSRCPVVLHCIIWEMASWAFSLSYCWLSTSLRRHGSGLAGG